MVEQGVPESLPRHIDHYINLPRSELATLPTDALGEMQFEIYSYVYHLQTVHNRQLAKADKCKYEIEKLIAPSLPNYREIYSSEQKWAAAVMDNDAARKYRDIEVNARAAATRTAYLTQRLENVARSLENIVKRRHNA